MWADYKAFLLRGNVIDLATAFILGVAFTNVVTAFTEDVMMQLIAATVGQPDFSDVVLRLRGTPIGVGAFLTAVVNFVLVATAVFLFLRVVTRLRRGAGEAEDKQEEQVALLRDIRDELRAGR